MSAFIIYVILLTLVYIIYYSAMITQEVYSKKGQATDATETFDVATMDEQIESVNVNESKGSFYIGETQPESVSENMEDLQEPSGEDVSNESEETEPSPAELHIQATEDKMEEVQVEYEDAMFAEDFACSLLNSSNSVPVVICTDVRDEL